MAPLRTDSASTCSTRTSVELKFSEDDEQKGKGVVEAGRAGFSTDV